MDKSTLEAIGAAAVKSAAFFFNKSHKSDARKGELYSAVAGYRLPDGAVLASEKSPSHLSRKEEAVDAFIAEASRKSVKYRVTEGSSRTTTAADDEPRLEYYLEAPKSK